MCEISCTERFLDNFTDYSSYIFKTTTEYTMVFVYGITDNDAHVETNLQSIENVPIKKMWEFGF